MKRLSTVALSAVLAAAVPAAAGAELACGADVPLSMHVRLEYGVTASRGMISLSGDGVVTYQRKGDDYAMESSLQALGIFEIKQRSAGTAGKEGLSPRKFTQQTTGRPTFSVDFDWPAQRVAFSRTGKSAPTKPQMQDRLSLLMQLAWRYRADPRARTIEVPVAGHRGASTYVFDVHGAETITVPAGRFDAVRFERHKEDGDETLEVWLATEICSLPARVRFTDDKGLLVEQQLRAVRSP
jgi:hypothetical protein